MVRKHPAPEGALRHAMYMGKGVQTFVVRKHPAPEGALRPYLGELGAYVGGGSENTQYQKVH